jgi:hypothetical protein
MIYKRGEVYWYKFMWKGKLVRESTKQGTTRLRDRWKQRTARRWPKARWGLGTRSHRLPLRNSSKVDSSRGQRPRSRKHRLRLGLTGIGWGYARSMPISLWLIQNSAK